MIYIPTYLRSESQPMYLQLTSAGFRPILVVDKTDPQDYSAYEHIRVPVKGIAEKRKWISIHAETMHIVADDDLQILSVDGHTGRTTLATKPEVKVCILLMWTLAKHYPHGGVHRRAFVNSARQLNYKINTGGYGSLLFYNKNYWNRIPHFSLPDNPPILTDLCSQLDMFKQQLPFAVITRFATKEVHSREHYQTGCWAPELGLKKLEVIDRAETGLLEYFGPILKMGRRREIIDWRATRAQWFVPEHLGGKPRTPQMRVTR